MPPTLKDSSTLPKSAEKAERASETPAASEEVSSAQPVALEVPVKVNGARAVEGSEKREPFSETTSTVLVLANGAVIRLSSSVAPGQLLFLTNEKTKKEVVCQVVKSKNYRSASGYVELEFTEPVHGFWGMRFPGERHTTQASATLPAARKSDSAGVTGGIPPSSADPKATSYADARHPAENVTSNLADAVQEFKTEIKTDSRASSKADFLAPVETSIDGLKLEANRLQEQLSALLFAEQKQSEAKPAVSVAPPSKQELGNAAAKILDMANDEPAAAKLAPPAKSDSSSLTKAAPKDSQAPKSIFDSEETKIPAWLEPLARNAAVPAPPAEEGASDSGNQFEGWQNPSVPESVSPQKHTAAPTKHSTGAPKQRPAAPLFGNSLLGETTPERIRPSGGSKGIWLAIAAGLVIAAGSWAWYFRDSLGLLAPAHSTSASNPSLASSTPSPSHPAAPANTGSVATLSPTSVTTSETPSVIAKEGAANALAGTAAPVSTPAQGKVQAAAITERIPKSPATSDFVTMPAKSVEVVEPENKKASLGAVRLAKPKVRRGASVQPNGEIAPALEVSSDALSGGENSLGANLAESSKQPAAPAAPVQVGGDVKPARIISSVPPVYPALAKTQHVSGDVRIDALIDATGRVTSMKVVAGPSLLHQAAMDSLRQWRYQAATLGGKPVDMHLTVTIQFRLQ
jgi:TonB family protein